MAFKDHFSKQAREYGRYRPAYPPELLGFVAAAAPSRAVALDVATGSGQAALGLAAHFRLVVGCEPSARQLAEAVPHARVRYVRAVAERLPFAAACADLLTVAQAAHWLDFARFGPEARRVLRPGGVCALWAYEKLKVEPAVDAIVDEFYDGPIGAYWPPERRHVEAGYRTLPFPFEELAAPSFRIDVRWTLDDLLGYLGTWSAVQRYRDARGEDPLPPLREKLIRVWPGGAAREAWWPVSLRIGRT